MVAGLQVAIAVAARGMLALEHAWHVSAAVLTVVWGAREHVIKVLVAYAALIRVRVMGEGAVWCELCRKGAPGFYLPVWGAREAVLRCLIGAVRPD